MGEQQLVDRIRVEREKFKNVGVPVKASVRRVDTPKKDV